MKTLLTTFTLVFTLMFSSTSFAEWTKEGNNTDGDTYYVDYERIRKHGGYVYYWILSDYRKPTDNGRLSTEAYSQGDCKIFRTQVLSFVFHNQPMGRDAGSSYSPENPEWEYPRPGSLSEGILQAVCRVTE